MIIVDNGQSRSGRKPLPDELKRSKYNVPLNQPEKTKLLKKANKSGMPLSVYIRSAALKQKIPVQPPEVNIEAYEKLLEFLDKLILIDEKVDWKNIDEEKVYGILQESEKAIIDFGNKAFS